MEHKKITKNVGIEKSALVCSVRTTVEVFMDCCSSESVSEKFCCKCSRTIRYKNLYCSYTCKIYSLCEHEQKIKGEHEVALQS